MQSNELELDIDGAFALLAAVLIFAAREARAGDRQAEVWLDAFSEGTWRQWPSEPRTLLKHDRGWRESSRHKSKPPWGGSTAALETGASVFFCTTTLLIVILWRILRVIKISLCLVMRRSCSV